MAYEINVGLGGKEISDDELTYLVGFIDRQSWRFAKSYAKFAPHEYVVVTNLDETSRKEFYKVISLIRENGFNARFGKYKDILYFIVGEHYYWTMGSPIKETIVLNRAKLSDYSLINGEIKYKKYVRSKFSPSRIK